MLEAELLKVKQKISSLKKKNMVVINRLLFQITFQKDKN